jgi:hypothetical protein
MRERLRRHPIPMSTWFRHSLVLAYAWPADLLEPLVPPGLELDAYGDLGFCAVALVQTEDLRPSFLPRTLGRDYFLTGYRIFVRRRDERGRAQRGLYILRSDTDSPAMVRFGNMLTHYSYRLADIAFEDRSPDEIEVRITTPGAEADLHVTADLRSIPAPLPAGSPFATEADARRFAGPLPYTFDHEPQTGGIVVIKGVRDRWDPQPVSVRVERLTFFDRGPFAGREPVLANAFHVAGVAYRWERGRPVPSAGRVEVAP